VDRLAGVSARQDRTQYISQVDPVVDGAHDDAGQVAVVVVVPALGSELLLAGLQGIADHPGSRFALPSC
jgi:hypothetical protein